MGNVLGKIQVWWYAAEDFCGLSSLDRWRSRIEGDIGRRLLALYRWSPEETELTKQIWQEYDSLDAARRKASRPRLPWQKEYSQKRAYREELLKLRHVVFTPISDEQMGKAPLFVCLDRFLQATMEEQLANRVYSWNAALSNWATFQNLAESRPDFLQGLSQAQQTSFRVLLDWWNNSYAEPALLEAARSFMECHRNAEYFLLPFHDEEVAQKTLLDHSVYHKDSFYLFCYEFHPRCWEPFESASGIIAVQQQRQQASCVAISQRFASAVTKHVRGADQVCTSYILPVRKDNSWFERTDRESTERPFYLWDATSRKTVQVDTFEVCPEYTCISHTWGRWRIKDKAATLPGVDWDVPENTLYDVRDLPDMLGGLGERYIWFDLFCIPQKRGNKRAEIEISRQAAIFRHSKRCIAWLNQCPSWTGVQNALRWLAFSFVQKTNLENSAAINEALEDESLLEAACGPVELMRVDPSTSAETPDPWFTSLWTLQETVLCPEIEVYSRDWQRLSMVRDEPLSLTTLAIFLNVAWTHCLSGDSTPFSKRGRSPGATGSIGSYSAGHKWLRALLFPHGVRSLVHLMLATQLDTVMMDLSPLRVLTAVGSRQYTARDRSAAIMSAIGVTDWYRKRLETETVPRQSSDTLVLGEFSLAFVREAAQKIGGLFFTCQHLPQQRSAQSYARTDASGHLWCEGTMLPISPAIASDWLSRETVMSIPYVPEPPVFGHQDHPSVREWIITSGSSVEMDRAGIVARSGSEVPVVCAQANITYLAATAMVPMAEVVNKTSPSDLSQDLAQIGRGVTLYAVALFQSGHYQTGVVLAQLLDQLESDSSRLRLVKIGDYEILGVPLPPSTEVNWLVV